uniref:Uncharacterized protein n=1 Tax=viral metagenome TaxID=1070528 RepID=A0A6M3LR44_9ZZZZ
MDNVLFFHGKTIDGRRFTIAGQFTRKGAVVKKDILLLGASLCSKKDIFIKRVGRCKAAGRIFSKNSKGHSKLPLKGVEKGHEIKAFIDYVVQFNIFKSKYLQKNFNL